MSTSQPTSPRTTRSRSRTASIPDETTVTPNEVTATGSGTNAAAEPEKSPSPEASGSGSGTKKKDPYVIGGSPGSSSSSSNEDDNDKQTPKPDKGKGKATVKATVDKGKAKATVDNEAVHSYYTPIVPRPATTTPATDPFWGQIPMPTLDAQGTPVFGPYTQPGPARDGAETTPALWEDRGSKFRVGQMQKWVGEDLNKPLEEDTSGLPDIDQEANLSVGLRLIDMTPDKNGNPKRNPIIYYYKPDEWKKDATLKDEYAQPRDWNEYYAIKVLNDRRRERIKKFCLDPEWSEKEREYLRDLLEEYDDASILEIAERHNWRFVGDYIEDTALPREHDLFEGRTLESVRAEYLNYKNVYDRGDVPAPGAREPKPKGARPKGAKPKGAKIEKGEGSGTGKGKKENKTTGEKDGKKTGKGDAKSNAIVIDADDEDRDIVEVLKKMTKEEKDAIRALQSKYKKPDSDGTDEGSGSGQPDDARGNGPASEASSSSQSGNSGKRKRSDAGTDNETEPEKKRRRSTTGSASEQPRRRSIRQASQSPGHRSSHEGVVEQTRVISETVEVTATGNGDVTMIEEVVEEVVEQVSEEEVE